ncbi:hypothetical protein FHT12_000467 [Xanthomonas campestris]|nr:MULTISPECIES: hypothetical protein [Xanthomonas]NIJ91809.1 hypothetical protein [Xanthomonas euroxanthea]NIK08012.1 hypothetical protein [Xanthomonas euroxanthea]
MTDDSSSPSEIKNKAIDYVAAGAKSILGAVPFAGSLLVELAGTVIPNQRIERISKFAAALDRRINQLEENFIHRRFSDEKFAELTEEAMRQAARSTSDERREYLASLVAHSLTEEEESQNDSRHLLRILGEINDVEIIWLRSFIGSYIGAPDDFWKTHESVLQPARAYIGAPQVEQDRHTLQESYKSHLESLGLLQRNLRLDRNKQPEIDAFTKNFAYHSPSTTPLGRMLLNVIGLGPNEESAG